jgi:hypothetical protein
VGGQQNARAPSCPIARAPTDFTAPPSSLARDDERGPTATPIVSSGIETVALKAKGTVGMPSSDSSDLRLERAIYLVGGTIVFLWGFEMLALTVVSIFDTLSFGSGQGTRYWVDESVNIFVGLVIILASFVLLFLAFRAHRSLRSSGTS